MIQIPELLSMKHSPLVSLFNSIYLQELERHEKSFDDESPALEEPFNIIEGLIKN